MAVLLFSDYIVCFRKQFLFQKGKWGHSVSAYYTNYNQERHLKNDQWAIMVFIHCGVLYGFTDATMLKELKISRSLYEILKEETPTLLQDNYPDKLLNEVLLTKIGLVQNVILANHSVRINRKATHI